MLNTASTFTVESGALYKVSITWKSEGTEINGFSMGWGTTKDGGNYVNQQVDESTDWVTTTNYIKTTATTLGAFIHEGAGLSDTKTIYIDSVTIKKVTNDLVAYYPLDADSSNTSNGVGITNDSVNGETLGNDIASSLTWVNSSSSPYETFVTSGNSITNAVNTSSFGIAYTSDFSLTSAKLYKISFDMDISSGSIDHVRIAIGTGMDTPTGLDEVPTNGTNTFYFIGNSTRSDFKFGFRGNDAVTFSLSNLSIKEVTSNTGVLK